MNQDVHGRVQPEAGRHRLGRVSSARRRLLRAVRRAAGQPHVYGLAGLVLLSLILNLAYHTWGLPRLWHPDEVMHRAFRMHSEGTLNPHFFAYPSLHLYTVNFLIIAPYEALTKFSNPAFMSDLYRWGRCLSAGMGALTVLMVYLIARFMGGKRAGLWAAFSLALSVGFVGFAHFGTVDIPLCFWMTTAFYACLHALRGERRVSDAVAGLLVGLAASTKYVGILLLLPLLLGLAWTIGSRPGGRSVRAHVLTPRYAMVLLGCAAGFLLGTPYALLAFPEFLGEFIKLMIYQPGYAGGDQLGFLPHVANLQNQMGVFLFPVAVLSLAWLAWTSVSRRCVYRAVLVVTVMLIYYKMGSMTFAPGRYIVVLVPLLAVCAGLLIAGSARWQADWPAPARLARKLALSLGVLYTLYYVGAGVWQIKYNDRDQARAWMQPNIPPESRIEVSTSYTFRFHPSYSNTARFPYFYYKETFYRMYSHPLYELCLQHAPWLGFDPAPPPGDRGAEPQTAGLASLLARKPDYLVLSESNFSRFLASSDAAAESFPKQHQLYTALLHGSTPYQIAADFRNRYSWYWPELEFIHAGIVIFKHEDS